MAPKEIKDFLRLQLDLNLARQDFAAGMLWGKPLLDRAKVPDGGGRAVVTLPGFGVPPASLVRLNGYLKRHNYLTQSFSGGIPQGTTFQQYIENEICPALEQRVQRLADRTGEPVSLVGQSAGGLYAREFARRLPEHVDRVITLGTPTFHPNLKPNANAALAYIVRRSSGMDENDMVGDEPLLHWHANEPELPYVAIYSPIDGAVSEAEAAIPDDIVASAGATSPRENIVVYCSHFGMTLNPLVLIAVADRLGQNRADWINFEGSKHVPPLLRSTMAGLAFPTKRPPIQHPEKLKSKPGSSAGSSRSGAARLRVVSLLRQDHENMIALMNTMERTLSGHQQPDYSLVFEGLHYLSRHADTFHHTREDILFERLRRRTQRADKPIDQLEREHTDLTARADRLLEQMRAHGNLATLRRNGDLNRRCRAYLTDLRQHLALEEQTVFVQVLEKLKDRDWIAVDAAIEYVDDPLFSRRLRKRYAQLNQAIGDAAETVSEEALFFNFLEFGAFLESAQALRRGAGKLNQLTLQTMNRALIHNSQAMRITLGARDLRTLLNAQLSAARGNLGLLSDFVSQLADVTKTAGNNTLAPYRKRSRTLVQERKRNRNKR